MQRPAGWYEDPYAGGNLRFWDGGRWTSFTAITYASPFGWGALALGLVACIGIYVPIPGLVLAIGGCGLAIGALRQDRDSALGVWALSLSAFVLALSVSGFFWSLLIAGLYGIVTSPAPP